MFKNKFLLEGWQKLYKVVTIQTSEPTEQGGPMKLLGAALAFVLMMGVSAHAQCGDHTSFQVVTCGCGGGRVQVLLCRGSGTACDSLTGPLVSCGGTCSQISAGDCLSARVFDLKSPSLTSIAQSLPSCGPAGQVSFADWLRIQLETKARKL